MKLRMKALTGITCPFQRVDNMMQSQGFRRCRNQPPVYNMMIRDMASGQVYRLTIPTRITMNKEKHLYLRLEHPSLEPSMNHRNMTDAPSIPESVIHAAYDKVEEVASYLRS